MIAFAASLALAAAMIAALYRLVIGPTLHDRAMAAYSGLLIATLWIAALAVLDARAEWLDIALALAFADFVIGVGVMKAFRARSLQTALARRGQAAS